MISALTQASIRFARTAVLIAGQLRLDLPTGGAGKPPVRQLIMANPVLEATLLGAEITAHGALL